MKKITISFAIAFCIQIISIAQPLKGRFAIGSGITFAFKSSRYGDTSKTNSNYNNSIGISPQSLYFVNNRLGLGGELHFGYDWNYQNNQQIGSGNRESNTLTLGIGFLSRYYIPVFVEKFGITLQSSITYRLYQFYSNSGDKTPFLNTNEYKIAISPGLYYFINSRLEIDLFLLSLQGYFLSSYFPNAKNGSFDQRLVIGIDYPQPVTITLLYHLGK